MIYPYLLPGEIVGWPSIETDFILFIATSFLPGGYQLTDSVLQKQLMKLPSFVPSNGF